MLGFVHPGQFDAGDRDGAAAGRIKPAQQMQGCSCPSRRAPTMATLSPAFTVRFTPRSTGTACGLAVGFGQVLASMTGTASFIARSASAGWMRAARQLG